MRICLFCPAKASSQEHIILAALGGKDTVAATCVPCNGKLGRFEDEFADHLLPFRQIAGIPNRREKTVPSVPAILQVGAFEERGLRHADGEISVRSREVDQAGNVVSESLRSTSLREVEAFKRRALEQGKKLIQEPAERITYSPGFQGTFHFLTESAAMRTAAKACYICLARHSRALAKSEAFQPIRDYIAINSGNSVRLFFSASFAKTIALGIREHLVVVVLDGLNHRARGVVVLMGGLHYMVDLSDSYSGADYEFTYKVNAMTGASHVRRGNERELLSEILDGNTKWNEIAFSGGHFGSLVPHSADYQFSVKPL